MSSSTFTTLIYGKNRFQMNQEITKIVKEFIVKNGAADEVTKLWVDEETDANEVLLSMQTMSLFSPSKLTILFDFASNNGVVEKVEQFCASTDQSTWLVLADSSLQARSKIVSALRGKADIVNVKPLSASELSQWCVTYVRDISKGKVTMNNIVASHLIDHVGEDQQQVAREIEKLVSGLGDEKAITKEYVDWLVELTPQGSVFAMLDAILAGRQNKAMQLYNEQLAQGEVAQRIMGMIVWQLTQLAIVVDGKDKSSKELTDHYGVSSFAVSKLRPVANKLSNKDLGIIMAEVMNADRLSRVSANADAAIEYIVSFIAAYLSDTKTATELAAV